MPSSESLFDDGKETVEKQVDLGDIEHYERDYYASIEDDTGAFSEALDIQGTVDFVAKHGFERVALQLPDELLHLAWSIVKALNAASQHLNSVPDYFVLGDTSYGSCCVDEVAALHNNAECLIHYGRTCLSSSKRLPVYFVFGRLPFDVDLCLSTLKASLDSEASLYLVYDCRYEYAMTQLNEALEGCFVSVKVATVGSKSRNLESSSESDVEEALVLGLRLEIPDVQVQKSVLLYIGAQSSQVTQLALKYNGMKLYTYNPVSGSCENASKKSNALLSKRFYKVECAKDAKIYGLLVGTMGVSGYAKVLAHLREVIEAAGRKCYTFSVGKLNPHKLGKLYPYVAIMPNIQVFRVHQLPIANFTLVDVYVLVACPQNSLIDSKDFYRPIVTPVEVEIALGVQQWSSGLSLDFQDLMREASERRARFKVDQESVDDAPHFSPVTGQLVSAGSTLPKTEDIVSSKGSDETSQLQGLGPRHITLRYSSPAGDLLAEQTFQGLEDKVGDKAPAAAVPGKSGIASELYSISDPDEAAR